MTKEKILEDGGERGFIAAFNRIGQKFIGEGRYNDPTGLLSRQSLTAFRGKNGRWYLTVDGKPGAMDIFDSWVYLFRTNGFRQTLNDIGGWLGGNAAGSVAGVPRTYTNATPLPHWDYRSTIGALIKSRPKTKIENAEEIEQRPFAPILFTSSQEACKAAGVLFKNFICAHLSVDANRVDLSLLDGRVVYILPSKREDEVMRSVAGRAIFRAHSVRWWDTVTEGGEV